jgi:S-DNA-T family DNA segregation ATPase FtsK/SpoIIIE
VAVHIESAKLAAILTDLVATASKPEDVPTIAQVLLHSARGYEGSDVGRSDLIVGTSTNRYAVGHTFTRAEGQLPGPMLWPVNDAHNLIAALKRKCKGEKDEDREKHAVKISRVGDLVEIIEDPLQRDLFGEKLWSTRFPVGNLDDYPRGVWDILLAGNRAYTPVIDDGREVEQLPRVDLDPAYLAPFVAIAKRRGWVLETYTRHHRLPVHIQIGPAYRGAVIPVSYSDGEEQRAKVVRPEADVYDPGLPPPPPPKPKKPAADAKPVELDEDGDDR